MDILKKLERLKEYASSNEPLDHIFFAVNQARGEMMSRVFDSTKGYKDVDGKSSPKPYSKTYANYRASLGRQTKVVDLSLTGNLMNSIRTVTKGTEVVITIQEDKKKLDDIQKRHSGKLERTVLTLSEEEEKIANELSAKLILEDLKTIFNAK
jgi:hypothetical protein